MGLAAVDTSKDQFEAQASAPVIDHDIVVIGCGFSGIGTGIKLLKKDSVTSLFWKKAMALAAPGGTIPTPAWPWMCRP